MILRTIANSFLPEIDTPQNDTRTRQKRMFVLINLALILLHIAVISLAYLSHNFDFSRERLLFNVVGILITVLVLSVNRRGFDFQTIAFLAQQYYTINVAIYVLQTGGGASPVLPWLCTLPVFCMLFLTGWRRVASLTIWVLVMLAFLAIQATAHDFSIYLTCFLVGLFSAYVSSVSGVLYQDDEKVLTDLANTDPLTGALNRRGLLMAVNNWSSGSLLVFDLDHFKLVNDSYGHAAGDEVLLEVCQRIRSEIRQGDWLARLGGEEFAVWFPNTSLEKSKALCDRLQAVVNEPFNLDESKAQLSISFSGGVSQYRGRGSICTLIADSDKLLYEAKSAGRNQILYAHA